MKLDQLRKIIREEVRAAVKEELQDILTEAVKTASTPELSEVKAVVPKKVTTKKVTPEIKTGKASLDEMLKMTQSSMTNEEYRNVVNASSDMVSRPNFASSMANQMGMTSQTPGIDISQLSFVKKAGAVLKKSNEIDQKKVGAL